MGSNYQKFDGETAPAPSTAVAVASPDQNEAMAGQTNLPVATPARYDAEANPAPYNPAATPAPDAQVNNATGLQFTPELEMPLYQITTMGNRSCSHKVFVVINIVAGLTGVNNFAAQAIALSFEGSPLMDAILRLYAMILFVVVVLTEFEKTQLVRNSYALMNWTSRGFFYTFLGVLGMVQYDVGINNYYSKRYSNSNYGSGQSTYNNGGFVMFRIPTPEEAAEWYVWFVSFLMVAMGCLYILLGICGMQRKLDQLRFDYANGKTITLHN